MSLWTLEGCLGGVHEHFSPRGRIVLTPEEAMSDAVPRRKF